MNGLNNAIKRLSDDKKKRNKTYLCAIYWNHTSNSKIKTD